MRIEKLGVKITDTPWEITVTPPVEIGGEMRGIRFAGQDWTREATEQVRDALTAALAEYDAMTTTKSAAPQFTVGQELAGDEHLPLGTVLMDGEGDRWYHLMPGLYSTDRGATDPSRTLSVIVSCYRGAKIVSLP